MIYILIWNPPFTVFGSIILLGEIRTPTKNLQMHFFFKKKTGEVRSPEQYLIILSQPSSENYLFE